ncbi:hypothetical protein SDRG_03046 [Saprolegnia diclina VS20]|uniref:USP domain-containing protein n=1 Tax=Saprolegnia diclina (strain VS20) TaxID=1156394 RepID=T0S3J0_SAPDV|nr:hypothetical protein SDRG_03046 [Saprolegnia diclina VS20]EQC39613.1 hypothetical protein SDRG_03046 [Saprolegnia diclina VS20]|eukprot:XP_008606885.1 hypothetical protein SDRG_03046 [Saprolegnia diclina VS20]
MDAIVTALLRSEHPDDVKVQYLDHILLKGGLTQEQEVAVAGVLWAVWPAAPAQHGLRQLRGQFLVAFRRYISSPSNDDDDEERACFGWMRTETRLDEWRSATKVLLLFVAFRTPADAGRLHRIFHECPAPAFGRDLPLSALCLKPPQLAEMLIKAGRIPLLGFAGDWLRELLLCVVASEAWAVLLKGGIDVLLTAAEQLDDPRTADGSLVVLETIFLGYQENADVFLTCYAHFYDRIARWPHASPPFASKSLMHLQKLLHGLLFAFPGHPLLQAPLRMLMAQLPPLPTDFVVETYVDARRWTNCAVAAASPFFASDDAGAQHATSAPVRQHSDAIGLKNIGNSCYMNAVLQGLYWTPAMRRLFATRNSAKPGVVAEFCALLGRMQASSSSWLDARTMERFRSVLLPEYQTTRQQDAAEFLHYLLDALESDKAVALHDVFQGSTLRTITCDTCSTASSANEEFTDLHIPIRASVASTPVLADLVRAQFDPEELSSRLENAYFCDICQCSGSATKRISVERAPTHLLVSINRFEYNRLRGAREKVCTAVDCREPVVLPTVHGDVPYDLYAAIVHAGTRADHGHYYTYARHLPDSDWHLLNDSHVARVDDAMVESALAHATTDTPYVLFYKRREATSKKAKIAADAGV